MDIANKRIIDKFRDRQRRPTDLIEDLDDLLSNAHLTSVDAPSSERSQVRAAYRALGPYLAARASAARLPGANQLSRRSMLSRGQSEARPWRTVAVDRVALVAVHTVATLMRLEDIIPLIEVDRRVRLVFTRVPDEFGEGVEQRLRDLEVRVIPWEEATQQPFDLAISASLHQMERIRARYRFAVPHGTGYDKLWPRLDWLGDKDERPRYGLDRRSLMSNGRPVFDALALSHPDHLRTLARQCPESLPAAVLAGDPCLDRLIASLPERELYRERLGVRPGQTLVALSSTWGSPSLLTTQRDLLLRLPAELPANHRMIATVHPAVWAETTPGRSTSSWLRPAWPRRCSGSRPPSG